MEEDTFSPFQHIYTKSKQAQFWFKFLTDLSLITANGKITLDDKIQTANLSNINTNGIVTEWHFQYLTDFFWIKIMQHKTRRAILLLDIQRG